MLDALRRTDWHNYSLFMRDDGLLFGYFETPESFQAALNGMAKEEINARWQDFMAPYFEGLGGAHADENMLELRGLSPGLTVVVIRRSKLDEKGSGCHQVVLLELVRVGPGPCVVSAQQKDGRLDVKACRDDFVRQCCAITVPYRVSAPPLRKLPR